MIFERHVATVMRVRNLPRLEAERAAFDIVLVERLNATHPDTDPNRCAWCGRVIGALVEGNSIRSTERMTDTHRDTVMRLMVEVGTGCAKLQNEIMRGLTCERIQVDEIWAFVGKKQKQTTPADNRRRVGDQWTRRTSQLTDIWRKPSLEARRQPVKKHAKL